MSHPAPRCALLCTLAGIAAACERAPPAADLGGPPPTPDERLADWEALPVGGAVPVSLGFAGTLPDSTIAALLERHGLRPYAVYMSAAGMATSQRRERSRASLEVLGEAREQAVAQLRTTLCAQQGRARALLASGAPGSDPVPLFREVLSHFRRLQAALPGVELGAPLAYGVEAVGEVAEVRAVGSDPVVAGFEPGWRGRVGGADTVVVPQPRAPADAADQPDPEIAALSAEDVRARMAQLAENGVGSCTEASGP